MPATEIVALIIHAAAKGLSPGPNTTLSAALGAHLGVRGALPFVVSVPGGWRSLLVVCSLGFGAVAARAEVRSALLIGAGADGRE